MIACLDARRGIGYRGELLAHLPEDMKHFRALTEGNVVIMGRRTMESLPGKEPLANRTNIVLSRTLSAAEGFTVCCSLPALWRELGLLHLKEPQRSFWCIGGAELYAELLPYARELHLTRLKQSYEADAFFPAFPGFALCSSDDRGACAFEHYVAADRLLKMKI